MSKFQKILLAGFLVALIALVYTEANKPEPINWFPSFHRMDKIPLGTYVLHELFEDAYAGEVTTMDRPPFEILRDSSLQGTYFFVNNLVAFDQTELDALYNWAENGNTVFIASRGHSRSLLDTFQLEMNTAFLTDVIGTEPYLNLTNQGLKGDSPYHLDRDLTLRYFEEMDTLNQRVLGLVEPYREEEDFVEPEANFLEIPVGDGYFYLHNQPEIFSNYFLLNAPNEAYTEGVLSYINKDQPLYWDTYYKSGKRTNISPLRALFANKYLKWAYYFILIGAVLFVLFEGKRKQRSIPIVRPPANKTYEYTRTIAGMYLETKEHHQIALKQITLFLEFIRTQLRVPTEQVNSRFFDAVASRSNNSVEDTKDLFVFIEKVQNQHDTSQEELIQLHQDITTFKSKLDGKS